MKDMGGNGNNNPRQPPSPPQPLQQCPRCNSFNTKFCYYNNYSVSQPRYLCKSCKRYWTQGGSLRNVPIRGEFCKGTKGPIEGGLAFGTRSSCSSSFIGECSRSQEQLVPPPLPQGCSGNPNLMRAPQSMVLQPNNIMSGSGPSDMNNPNQLPNDVDEDDYLVNYSPPPPSPPSSSS